MLSELGQNISKSNLESWNKNELVYYFNCEKKFDEMINTIENNFYVNQ
jgi:hypothetical protein